MRALGTEVGLRGEGTREAAAELQRLESLLTRFRPSPLTRLNACGRLEHPPLELVAALRHALHVAEVTDGLVTPSVGRALAAAGYRRSWPDVDAPEPAAAVSVADWRRIVADEHAIVLPDGCELDLGGTAKSWIAERLLARLGGAEAWIDAGGDVIGRSGGHVAVDVAHPSGGPDLQLVLPPGTWGVATSSVLARAWPGAHHLIDPRSAAPAVTTFTQATVVAPSLRRAEVITKLVLLGALGEPGGSGEPATATARAWVDGAAMVVAFDRSHRAWRRVGGGWGTA